MSEAGEFTNPVERSPLPPLRIFPETKANPDHPERNEDSIFVDEQTRVAIILDGVGGLEAGDKASRMAGAFILERLVGIPEDTYPEQTGRILKQTLIDASTRVKQEVPGGGTTATAVKFVRGGNQDLAAVIAHVGDSRAYVLRRHGQGILQKVTEDDLGILQGLSADNRRIFQEKLDRVTNKELLGGFLDTVRGKTLNSSERALFRRRNELSQTLGGKTDPTKLNPHIYICNVDLATDALILTTDGIHDNLTRDEIEMIVRNIGVNLIAQRLVSEAYRRSLQDIREKSGQLTRSHHDDMSAVVVRGG